MPNWIKHCSNSMQLNVSKNHSRFNHDQIPTKIKCSLCKSSTPRKFESSENDQSFYESAESHLKSDVSNISMILSPDDETDSHKSQNAGHYANRLIVRIFATPK